MKIQQTKAIQLTTKKKGEKTSIEDNGDSPSEELWSWLKFPR